MAIQIKLGELVLLAAHNNMIQHTSGMNLNKDSHKRKCLSVFDFFFWSKERKLSVLFPILNKFELVNSIEFLN